MSKDCVIGGIDRGFKLKLYHALRKMNEAWLMWDMTSAFRDDDRQSIASGSSDRPTSIDPPHVRPIDAREHAAKRGGAKMQDRQRHAPPVAVSANQFMMKGATR